MFYTGIGSRRIDKRSCDIIQYDIAPWLAKKGFVLRSGAATGADTAFEVGHDSVDNNGKEIYVYDSRKCPQPGYILVDGSEDIAMTLSIKFHPRGSKLSHDNRITHARNCCQVLGRNCQEEESKMVICWTPDGVTRGIDTTINTGGSGQVIRVASSFNIPIFNIRNLSDLDSLIKFVESSKINAQTITYE